MRAPFVYCSPATKEVSICHYPRAHCVYAILYTNHLPSVPERKHGLSCLQILLRLEKYHYRINFAKGILESRNVTYDRSMRKLTKPIPLDTPTTIELAPGNSIRVTLIDANHCIGAVMFLIEGDGKAILYTGDIRAETWWVNSLVQCPVLLPYTLGKRRLKCMYLDTTFATKREPYRNFPSKAEGIRELLDKISQFSDDTIFYFHSWTFGYESVWLALSTYLESRIHLDSYRANIYGSLSTLDKRQLREIGLNVQTDNKSLRESGLEIREATALCGFRNGNHIQAGCLTSRESVRIHSCERGMGCRVIGHDAQAKVVHIIPIITRSNGTEIAELGAGGGKGDLDHKEELETGGVAELGRLMEVCAATIQDEKLLSKILALLHEALGSNDGKVNLEMQLQKASVDSQDGPSLRTLVAALSTNATKSVTIEELRNRTIRFPYSRHSSYSELCDLVRAFEPQDVFPCTVDEAKWTPDLSMQSLFGQYCSASIFRHDVEMTDLYEARVQQQQREKRGRDDTQADTQTTDDQMRTPDENQSEMHSFAIPTENSGVIRNDFDGLPELPASKDAALAVSMHSVESQPSTHRDLLSLAERVESNNAPLLDVTGPSLLSMSVQSDTASARPLNFASREPNPEKKLTNRRLAYEAAIGACLTWADYGGLTSTRNHEEREEQEL